MADSNSDQIAMLNQKLSDFAPSMPPMHSYLRTISLYINKVINHSRHITTMLGMVEAGIGIAAVPAMSMPAGEHSVLRAVPLTDPVVTRTVGLIRLSGRIQSYVAAELEKLIIEQYPSG